MKRISKNNGRKINRYMISAAFLCGAILMSPVNVSAEETMPPDEVTVVSRETTVVTGIQDEIVEKKDSEIEADSENSETIEESELHVPSGNGILLEDVFDETVNRQFLTIQSKNGNTFYIVVDKDSQGRENVYFMNTVDEYDLLAFAEDFPENAELETHEVSDNSNGSDEESLPDEPSEKNTDNPSPKSSNRLLVLIIVLILAGGGAFYFFKVKGASKPAQKSGLDDDFDYDEEESED